MKPSVARAVQFLVFLLLMAAFLAAGRWVDFDHEALGGLLSAFPVWAGPAVFVILYVVLTFFIWFAVKDVFRIGGAVLFGGLTSALAVWLAEMVSAALHFALARRLGRGFVEQKLKGKSPVVERFSRDTRVLNVVTLRINPLVPFRVMDLCAGLTSLSLLRYLLTISLVSFARIYWGQSVMAVVGDALLKDPLAAMELVEQRTEILTLSGVYFGAVAILTLVSLVRSARDVRRGRRTSANGEGGRGAA